MKNFKFTSNYIAFLALTNLFITINCFALLNDFDVINFFSQSDIKSRLYDAANKELSALEVVMTDNAATSFKSLINKAADQLEQDNADESQIRETERKVVELVRYLKDRGTVQEDRRVHVDLTVITGIRDWLCPTYPFC